MSCQVMPGSVIACVRQTSLGTTLLIAAISKEDEIFPSCDVIPAIVFTLYTISIQVNNFADYVLDRSRPLFLCVYEFRNELSTSRRLAFNNCESLPADTLPSIIFKQVLDNTKTKAIEIELGGCGSRSVMKVF